MPASSRTLPSQLGASLNDSSVIRAKQPLTAVSLYSGAGGFDLGFKRAGFNIAWANDLDGFAVATYADLVGDHVVPGSVDVVSTPALGSADVVIGGPPCQGFSVAGKQNPDDGRSRHVFRFLEVIGDVSPQAFVMENVSALATGDRWSSIRDELIRVSENGLGYRTHLLILNASDFGVAQSRRRMFLVGFRDLDSWRRYGPPEPTTRELPVTVRQALTELPRHGSTGNDNHCPAGVTPALRPVLRRSPYAGMLFNGRGRPLDPDRPAPALPASMGGNATPILDQQHFDGGGESWVVWYHRHLIDGGEPVLRAPSHLRRITVEEAAMLQGFPSGIRFSGPQTAQYRQIGNSVPPPLAEAVANSVARALGGTEAPGGVAVERVPLQRPLELANL